MRLRILGPMQVWDGAEWQTIGAPKLRALLAALLVRPGTGVSVQQLIEDIWGDDPPRGAVNQVHGYVARLRRALADADGQVLVSRTPGYTLRLCDDDVDARRFEVLTADGLTARRRGDTEAAARLLTEALGLWRGPALADVPSTLLVEAEADRLQERRLVALEARINADLALGQHAELVPELQVATAENPLREHLWAHLMLALYRSGRQADALDAYQRLYRHLDSEIGIEPDRHVRDLHQRVLQGDPALDLDATVAPAPVVPRQLPAAVRHFAGREPQLKALDEIATQNLQTETTAVAVVTGTAGVGKTSTVVKWAHRVAGQFPDGQLYINLRGFEPTGRPMEPSEALRGLLDALAVPPDRVPATLDAQAALYRSVLADRRMLVVLDNARDVDQVRPLLPGSASCVVVTSRNQLSGLIASEGAVPVTLDLLTDVEAYRLLSSHLGPERLADEPDAAATLIERCARLPLALSIAAAPAALEPDLSLADLAGQLADTRDRLDHLDAGEQATNLRVVLSWSYRSLSPEAMRLFRLLGLHPGPDVSVAAAASLARHDVPVLRRLLRELVRAHLVTEQVPDRFSFHDLLRAYAAELAATVDTDAERHEAIHRMLDHYLHTAHAGTTLIEPHRSIFELDQPLAGVRPERLDDPDRALAWFNVERRVLIAVVELAERTGFDAHTWRLARAMSDFLERVGHWQDWISVQAAGIEGATRHGNLAGLAQAHRHYASACIQVGRHTEARDHLQRSLDLFQEIDDRTGQAEAHHSMGWMFSEHGEYAEALDHYQQALDLSQQTGNRAARARALNNMAWYHTMLGDHEQAVGRGQQALALAQELDDEAAQAAIWDTIGVAHHHLGNAQDAVACFEESLVRYRRQGDHFAEADVLTHRAESEQAAGDLQAARSSWQQALDHLVDLGHPSAAEVRARLTEVQAVDRDGSSGASPASAH